MLWGVLGARYRLDALAIGFGALGGPNFFGGGRGIVVLSIYFGRLVAPKLGRFGIIYLVQAQCSYLSFWALGDVVEGPKKNDLGLSKKTPLKQAVWHAGGKLPPPPFWPFGDVVEGPNRWVTLVCRRYFSRWAASRTKKCRLPPRFGRSGASLKGKRGG